jgi:hypothetical protein
MEIFWALTRSGENSTSNYGIGKNRIQNPPGIHRSDSWTTLLTITCAGTLGLLARLRIIRQPCLKGLDDSSLTENIIGRKIRIVKENMYSVESGSESGNTCLLS